MGKPFAIGALGAAMIAMGLSAGTSPAQEPGTLPSLRQEARQLTNEARAEAGLSPLGQSDRLDRVAQGHAEDMLRRGYYDHVSPEGETPRDRFLAAGGSRWGQSGENIATCRGCRTPADSARVQGFHRGWMQSPGHRENIMSRGYDSFGFGIAGQGDRIFAVQTFSGPGGEGGRGGSGLTPSAARNQAKARLDAARAGSGADPLAPSEALDSVAEQVLARLADDPERLPQDVFGLLPQGSTGWTSLALQSATIGGAGATLTEADVTRIIDNWAAARQAEGPLGGRDASHFGFAAEAAGDGRITAVAVFGGRG